MSRRIPLFACLALLALSLAPASAQTFRPKAEYTMQVNVGPVYDWSLGAQKWADLIREKTSGRLNVKPYFGSSLLAGKQTNWFQAVSEGSIDFAVESTINASSVIKSMNLFSLPFFINTYPNVDRIENGKAGKKIIQDMEKGGVKFLAWGENGFRQVTNSKRPITRPEDMRGTKMRVVGSPIFIDIFKALGSDPVSMNWADAVTAFQQGVVDGQENPKSILTVVKIWEYHKYMTNWNYLVDPLVFVVNERVWRQFPADIQKAVEEAAVEAAAYEKALARAWLDGDASLKVLRDRFGVKDIPDPVKMMQDKGMTIVNLAPEQLQAFQDATKSIYDKWIPQIGRDVYEMALQDMR
jgi:tripartite ATP-independent transporter DctP family solute receptor